MNRLWSGIVLVVSLVLMIVLLGWAFGYGLDKTLDNRCLATTGNVSCGVSK